MSCPACGDECKQQHPAGPGFVMYRGYTKEEAMASIGPGWRRLIKVMFNHIELNRESESYRDLKITQVKEKFGSLRIYISGGDESSYGLVTGFEIVSTTICEACGMPGSLRYDRSWILTLCDECHKKERPFEL